MHARRNLTRAVRRILAYTKLPLLALVEDTDLWTERGRMPLPSFRRDLVQTHDTLTRKVQAFRSRSRGTLSFNRSAVPRIALLGRRRRCSIVVAIRLELRRSSKSHVQYEQFKQLPVPFQVRVGFDIRTGELHCSDESRRMLYEFSF